MTNRDGNGKGLSPHVVWAMTVIVLTLIGVSAYIATTDLEPARYASLFGTVVAPSLGLVIVILQNGKQNDKAAKLEEKVDKVEQQTNGALTKQINDVKDGLQQATDLLQTVVDDQVRKEEP